MWLQKARNTFQRVSEANPSFRWVYFSAEPLSGPHQVHQLLNPTLQLPRRTGFQVASAWQ